MGYLRFENNENPTTEQVQITTGFGKPEVFSIV
jgi:hypothetical protein